MKKRHLICLLLSVFLLLFSGCACKHQWREATCSAPATCELCGETQGEPLAHQWEAATCEKPETCKLCGATKGTTGPHTVGEWETDEPDYISGSVWKRRKCTVCGMSVEMELQAVPIHENGHFTPSPEELSERLGKMLGLLNHCSYTTRFAITDNGTMGCTIMDGYQQIAVILFSSDNGYMDGDEKSSRNTVSSMFCSFYTSDTEKVAPVLLGMILTCDNTLEFSDAREIARNILINSMSTQPYLYNEVNYLLGTPDGDYLLVISAYEK